MTELLNGFHIFSKLCSVTDTVVHRCVCVCVCVCLCKCASVCEWMHLYHTFNVLQCYPFTVVYFFQHCGRFVDWTHKNSQNFCVFVDFPFISYGRSFLTKEHNCDYFLYDHLACSNQALNFLVCSHSKCHKSHQVSYHSDEAVIFKKFKTNFIDI